MKKASLFLLLTSGLFIQPVFGQLPDSLKVLFNYQKINKPKYTVDSSFSKDGVSVQRIQYLSVDSFVVSAYLTRMKTSNSKSPLMIMNHWGEGDKNEFLEEAVSFSKQGFACILPDEPWLCPNTPIKSFTKQGYEMYRQSVMNSRTAIDLIENNFAIDSTKIFYVGHSFGCNVGAILSGVEKRIDFYVFMAGVYSSTKSVSSSTLQDFVDWRTNSPEQFKSWIIKLRPLDAELYLPYKTAPCLIQTANKDEYVTVEENMAFIEVTPQPKEVRSYESTHFLNEQAQKDRMKWVMDRCNKK